MRSKVLISPHSLLDLGKRHILYGNFVSIGYRITLNSFAGRKFSISEFRLSFWFSRTRDDEILLWLFPNMKATFAAEFLNIELPSRIFYRWVKGNGNRRRVLLSSEMIYLVQMMKMNVRFSNGLIDLSPDNWCPLAIRSSGILFWRKNGREICDALCFEFNFFTLSLYNEIFAAFNISIFSPCSIDQS